MHARKNYCGNIEICDDFSFVIIILEHDAYSRNRQNVKIAHAQVRSLTTSVCVLFSLGVLSLYSTTTTTTYVPNLLYVP